MERKVFETGCFYKVTTNFQSGSEEIYLGEILKFIKAGYSPYDSSYVYEFRDEDGNERAVWLHEKASTEVLKQRLEEIPV